MSTFHLPLIAYMCCLLLHILPCRSIHNLPHYTSQQVVSKRPSCPPTTKNRKDKEREASRLKEKTRSTNVEINGVDRTIQLMEKTSREYWSNSNRSRNRDDRQRSKSRNNQSSAFCNHRRMFGHNVSDCLSIKRKENGR